MTVLATRTMGAKIPFVLALPAYTIIPFLEIGALRGHFTNPAVGALREERLCVRMCVERVRADIFAKCIRTWVCACVEVCRGGVEAYGILRKDSCVPGYNMTVGTSYTLALFGAPTSDVGPLRRAHVAHRGILCSGRSVFEDRRFKYPTHHCSAIRTLGWEPHFQKAFQKKHHSLRYYYDVIKHVHHPC
eukprot:1194458-Prorocentrum_minimum.AAC.6